MAMAALQNDFEFPHVPESKDDLIRELITEPLNQHRRKLNVVWFTARTWREARAIAYLACKKGGLKTTRCERYFICNLVAIAAQLEFTSAQRA